MGFAGGFTQRQCSANGKEKLPPEREEVLARQGNAVFLGNGTNLFHSKLIVPGDVLKHLRGDGETVVDVSGQGIDGSF